MICSEHGQIGLIKKMIWQMFDWWLTHSNHKYRFLSCQYASSTFVLTDMCKLRFCHILRILYLDILCCRLEYNVPAKWRYQFLFHMGLCIQLMCISFPLKIGIVFLGGKLLLERLCCRSFQYPSHDVYIEISSIQILCTWRRPSKTCKCWQFVVAYKLLRKCIPTPDKPP